ncbi:hypothetical protein ABTY61_28840 [Kitasatospora sp. NPDC096128]|uniref:hypothetical protein n=1 Tax=Kitasatospora sp. NPDC096128 TaxID=3155547 RepID=UPI00331FAD2A
MRIQKKHTARTTRTTRTARTPRLRRAATAAALALAATALGLGSASPASALSGPSRCDLDVPNATHYCATVTAINPGSFLAIHNEPNYTGGSMGGRLGNGEEVVLYCWTTGAGDADGHGDTYWFYVHPHYAGDTTDGYVNDWYLTTGSYSQWSGLVNHC